MSNELRRDIGDFWQEDIIKPLIDGMQAGANLDRAALFVLSWQGPVGDYKMMGLYQKELKGEHGNG